MKAKHHKLEHSHLEFVEKILHVTRCAKVVSGGRRFSFSALAAVGDKIRGGRLGIGLGKGLEVVDAKAKAINNAKKAMIRIPLRDNRTLHYDLEGRYGAGHVILRSAPPGKGIIAGGPVRIILELLGLKDVVAKSIGSRNKHNMTKAALAALVSINTPKTIAEKRGKRVAEILSYRNRNSDGKGGDKLSLQNNKIKSFSVAVAMEKNAATTTTVEQNITTAAI